MAVRKLNKAYQQVKEFHAACGIGMPEKPTMLSGAGYRTNLNFAEKLEVLCDDMKSKHRQDNVVLARASYMLEELVEFLLAETIEDQIDALADGQYYSIGTNTLIGVKPEQIFNIVNNANMGKVVDGKVIRNEQGKIQKPEGWKENFAPEPKIIAEIERQSNPRSKCDRVGFCLKELDRDYSCKCGKK